MKKNALINTHKIPISITICDHCNDLIKIDRHAYRFSYKRENDYIFEGGRNSNIVVINLRELSAMMCIKGYINKKNKLCTGAIYSIIPMPVENRLWGVTMLTVDEFYFLVAKGKLYWSKSFEIFIYESRFVDISRFYYIPDRSKVSDMIELKTMSDIKLHKVKLYDYVSNTLDILS